MKIIIYESQLNRLFLEQDTGFSRSLDRTHSNVETSAKFNREIIDFYKQYHHQINSIASIGLSFIPIIGTAMSSTIALVDAKQYYDENDKKTAGMVAMFSMIPIVGPLISKIPGVKELGVKGMAALASKLGKSQKLTQAEETIVKSISTNQKLVQTEALKKSQEIAKKTIPQKITQGVKKVGKFTAKNVAPYAVAGGAYEKLYDKLNTPKIDFTKINTTKVSEENKKAALEIKF